MGIDATLGGGGGHFGGRRRGPIGGGGHVAGYGGGHAQRSSYAIRLSSQSLRGGSSIAVWRRGWQIVGAVKWL